MNLSYGEVKTPPLIKSRTQAIAIDGDGNEDEDTDCSSDEDSDGGNDEEITAHDRLVRKNRGRTAKLLQQRITMKCAGLWRTIILSSMSKTLYPYSQSIRKLNLGDLEDLLTDPSFGAVASK